MIENYDHVILIKNLDHFKIKSISWREFESTAREVFNTYMGERLMHIEFHDLADKINCFLIGLLLNPDMMKVFSEKGPVYGTADAIEFKKLWGDMSKIIHINGSVHECVIWPENGNLTLKIVNFIMKEKLGFPSHGPKGGWHQIYCDQFNKYLRRFEISNDCKNGIASIDTAYDILSNAIAITSASDNMRKLPVHINELKPIGSWSKSTNVFPERCISLHGYNPSITIDRINPVYQVALVVEANNKWPNDIDAFILMKKLFICKISRFLYEDKKIISKVLTTGEMDVFVADAEFQEIGKKRKGARKMELDWSEPFCNISKPLRDYMLTHALILNINVHVRTLSNQFGKAYSDTCRLVKRWLASQYIDIVDDNDERITDFYLSNDDSYHHESMGWCMTDVAIELIVAHIFIHQTEENVRVPQSSLCGFMRFLKLMFKFNWEKNPMVVNLNKGFTDERFAELSQPFLESDNRHSQLPMVVIRTPLNIHGDHWTNAGPNVPMLVNIVQLARQTYYSIKHVLISESDLKPIFTIDTSRFDVLFHLKPSIVNLIIDQIIDVKKGDMVEINRTKKQKINEKYQGWPKAYDDSPFDNLMNWIRSFVQSSAICSFDKFGCRFIGLKWLKMDVDKEMIIRTICNKNRDFISKCDILE